MFLASISNLRQLAASLFSSFFCLLWIDLSRALLLALDRSFKGKVFIPGMTQKIQRGQALKSSPILVPHLPMVNEEPI